MANENKVSPGKSVEEKTASKGETTNTEINVDDVAEEVANQAEEDSRYTIHAAMQVTDDILKLGEEKRYNIGAFVHGVTLALEYMQTTYNIPQQQMAEIRRDCRRHIKELSELQSEQMKNMGDMTANEEEKVEPEKA